MAKLLTFEALHPLIQNMIDEGGKLVCLDGRSCAGKSTLAAQLEAQYGCGVVHMDDFFLPPDKRTSDCNIDFVRFRSQVSEQLHLPQLIYDAYNCQSGTSSPYKASTAPFILVEGCYSLHPSTGLTPDLRLFADISIQEQKQRLLKRNGKEGYARFSDIWLPREEAYFREFSLPDMCSQPRGENIYLL